MCIYQIYIDERSSQVAIMREIYESAESVIVWLGKEEESTSLAYEMMSAISTAIIPTK